VAAADDDDVGHQEARAYARDEGFALLGEADDASAQGSAKNTALLSPA